MIHDASPRAETGTFVKINCGAIPGELLESELFGYESGAFTGASKEGKAGYFEIADKGTLLLDEIADLPLKLQVKLLSVIQDHEITRLGGTRPKKVDVRIIAATNKSLEKAVASREFREDLFYRLNVVRIRIPPLRERREDISLLINYFLRKMAQGEGQQPKTIAPDAISALEKHPWPGNVRELENAIQRALVVAKGGTILLQDLPPEVVAPPAQEPVAVASREVGRADESASTPAEMDVVSLARLLFQWAKLDPKRKIIPAVERELVINALAETHGNQVQAAKLLGITRATLRKRVAKFNIKQELSIR
jgi:two-component system nitrogen regulation response regulator GlnG